MYKLNNKLIQTYEEMAWTEYHAKLNAPKHESLLKSPESARNKPSDRASFFENYPTLKLEPTLQPLDIPISTLLQTRSSNYQMDKAKLKFGLLSDLLSLAYCIRPNTERSGRNVASAGALYPIDVYMHCAPAVVSDNQQSQNLFYYDVNKASLKLLPMDADVESLLSNAFVQADLFTESPLHVFFTMHLEDIVKKYGEKGYQLALFEVGHIAQNFNLAATALELSSINISGFNPRILNRVLLLDGLVESVVYSIFIG